MPGDLLQVKAGEAVTLWSDVFVAHGATYVAGHPVVRVTAGGFIHVLSVVADERGVPGFTAFCLHRLRLGWLSMSCTHELLQVVSR